MLPDTLKVLCSEAFRDCTMLTSVQIPENVERIEERAFYNCAKLRTVGIPASGALVSVGDYAFAYCGCLSRFDIPTKLTSINATAFYSDMSMVLVTVSAENARFSIQNDALVASGHLVYYPTGRGGEYTVAPSVTAIDAYAFAYSQIRLAVLPEELTTIGESAFLYSCLERLDLPEMLTMLGEGCFECNYYLKSVRLNSQLKIIPEKAFSFSTGLTELIVPENVQLYEVGNDAFSCCSLSDITSFSQNLTVIGKRAFQYNNFSEIKLGKNVQLWDEAFYGCMELSDVQFAEDTSRYSYCRTICSATVNR
ncbi:MAG: leucine-rich repeat protein [Oscillospiraceae bacterium]